MANFEIRGWVLDSANLLSTIFRFRASVWCLLELKNHFRRDIRGNENNVRKVSSDICGNDSRTAHQKRENGILWKILRDDEWFPRSKTWSCTSSRILAVAREVENGFRANASSSSSCSGKYHWNSISRDWRWFITDVFKFLASSSVFSTTLDNFSRIVTYLTLIYEATFATSNKTLADSSRHWMLFVPFLLALDLRYSTFPKFRHMGKTFSNKSCH